MDSYHLDSPGSDSYFFFSFLCPLNSNLLFFSNYKKMVEESKKHILVGENEEENNDLL